MAERWSSSARAVSLETHLSASIEPTSYERGWGLIFEQSHLDIGVLVLHLGQIPVGKVLEFV